MQRRSVINFSTIVVLTLVVTVRSKIDQAASEDEHAELLKQFAKSGGNTAGIDLSHIKSYLNRTQAPGLPVVGGIGFGQLKEKERPPVPTRSLPSKRTRASPTTRRVEPESVIGPVPARFKPNPTCQLKATDIIIIVDNTASGSAIVEHNTFRFLRNMFGKMDVRPNGIRVALDTGGRQVNRRLTPSTCLDVRCVYEFMHTFVRDTNPERARFRNQTGLNLQPIVYDPFQAALNFYMYNEMTMFSGRTKVLFFLTYGKFQGKNDTLKLIENVLFDVGSSMKKVSMFLSLDLKESYRYEKSFNSVWRPRVSRLKLMTEAEYWANRLCQFLKTGQDKVAVTPKAPSQECIFSEVSRGCKMGLFSCSEIIDQIPEDPQNCKAPQPRQEVCPEVEECTHNCDVSTTPWTNWACFAACEDSNDEHQPRMYRNRQLLVGAEPMACLLFETEEGCHGLLPPCPNANLKSRNFGPPIEGVQEAVQCRYTASKICRYIQPGVCNGVEVRRSSTGTANCPARRKQVKCESHECDEDCDKRMAPWSQWSSCPACVPADKARPPIATRDRRLVRQGEVYCITKQGRICSNLPLCRDSDDDENGSGQELPIDTTPHSESKFSEEQEIEIKRSAPPSTDCQFDRIREPCQLRKDSDDAEDGPKCSSYEKLLPVASREGPDCQASANSVECAKEECLVLCDKISGQWSEWTSCSASCADATGYKQAVVKRRRTAEKGCQSEQVNECGSALLPCPREDEKVKEELAQEMELSVGRPEEQASSVRDTGRYTTVTVIIVGLIVLVFIAILGMAVVLYFLRENDVNDAANVE